MNGYLLSVIGTILLSAIITAILPDGKTSTMIKNVTKLACVLAIVAPVLQFFTKTNAVADKNSQMFFSQSVIRPDEEFIQYYWSMRIRATESAISKELKEKYSVNTSIELLCSTESETVDGKYQSDEIKVTKIYVRFEEEPNEEVKRSMWEYLTKNYCSEVLLE